MVTHPNQSTVPTATYLCCSQHLSCEDCWGKKNTETPPSLRWGKACSDWRFPFRWAGNQSVNKEREKALGEDAGKALSSLGENRAAFKHLSAESSQGKKQQAQRPGGKINM